MGPLERIASALERLVAILEGDSPGEAHNGPTLTNPPLTWFVPQTVAQEPAEVTTDEGSPSLTGQTTWEWLGVRAKPGRPHNNPGHCGRCGREGTRRLNNCNHCHYCKDEEWWDE